MLEVVFQHDFLKILSNILYDKNNRKKVGLGRHMHIWLGNFYQPNPTLFLFGQTQKLEELFCRKFGKKTGAQGVKI